MLYGCAGEGRTVFMEKKTASAITLTLLLTSMLTMAFSIQPVKAIGTIYIRADGSIDPPSAPIQSDGDLYTLTCDIVTDSYLDGIIIERDNMTLDGNGHFVEGILADESVGIGLDGRSNITIKNLEVKAFQYGIQLANSSDCNISGNNITNNSLKGVSLYNSANNTFRNNMVNGSIANFEVEGDHMLAFFQDVDDSNMLDGKPLRYLINQENATIDNSTYSSIGYLALINSTNLVIEELKLENNTQGMLLAYTRNSQVINNNIRNNAIYGIKLVECTNITISGNNIVNNGLVASSWWWPRYGVCFESSNNNFLFGNNMSRNYSSVWLNSSSNNIILENDMTDSQHITGVRLGNSSFNTIQGNNLTNFVTIFFAFFVDSSSFNNISENKITAGITGIGFILRDSSYNNISENDMNQIRGLNLETSNFNIVLGNKVIAPDDDVYAFGIFLGDSSSNNRIIENSMEAKNGTNVWLSNSTGNMLFHNNFMACMRQAYDYSWDEQAIPPSVNVWDDGYPSGGNYWSDYTGIDQKSGSYQNETGSDGMGDLPYAIDANNTDHYPLMNPWPSGWKLDFAESTNHPIVDLAVYNGRLYAAADNKLYVKDGSSWNVVDAPMFVTSLEPYGGKLVVGGQGGLYCYDGTPFNLIFSVLTYIKVLGVYNNTLYAGTMLDNPPKLYYCSGSADNPADWHVETDFSAVLNFSGPFGSIDSFHVYDSSTNNLIGYWRLDEGSGNLAYDSSGNSHDGTIYGASWTTGITGNGLGFDGDDLVVIPDSPDLNPSEITVETWVNFGRLAYGGGYSGTDDQMLVCKGGWPRGGSYRIWQGGPNSSFQVLFFDLGWLETCVASPEITLQTNRWYHLAGTYDGNMIKLYLDGVLQASRNIGSVPVGNAEPLYLGYHDETGWNYYLNGSLDEAAIYSYAKTAEEIHADYVSEYGKMYIASGGSIFCYNGTAWNIARTFDDVYAYIDMEVYNGKMYLATRDQGWRQPLYQGGTGFSGRVIEFDGENWTTILDHDYWVYSLGVYDGKLYAGTANKILTYDGSNWETSFNASEGAYYALCFENYDGKIYAGMGNGYIFADPAPLKAEHETIVVPEFSSFLVLPLFMTATLLAVMVYRRKRIEVKQRLDPYNLAHVFSCFPNQQCEVKWDSETLNLLTLLSMH